MTLQDYRRQGIPTEFYDTWSRVKDFKVLTPSLNAAWNTSNVNGAVAQTPLYLRLNTSITASSRALAFIYCFGLNSNTLASDRVDWDKRLEFTFRLESELSDVEVIHRVQLKEINTEGILAAKGIGLEVNNFACVGEAYGSARGTIALGNLLVGRVSWFRIIVMGSRVQFWMNGVWIGDLTGTAVPTGAAGALCYVVVSLINGLTGGVNAVTETGDIHLIQEW